MAVLKVETDIIIYESDFSRQSWDTSDNVCQDIQKWCYCFYL